MSSLNPRDVLDDIWDLIGLVSEGFPTYFCDVLAKRILANADSASNVFKIYKALAKTQLYC